MRVIISFSRQFSGSSLAKFAIFVMAFNSLSLAHVTVTTSQLASLSNFTVPLHHNITIQTVLFARNHVTLAYAKALET
jgi:hypothetical protein